ncbi:MAG: hypothetical protein ACOYMB_03590 [Patescibacteria group bacterium]
MKKNVISRTTIAVIVLTILATVYLVKIYKKSSSSVKSTTHCMTKDGLMVIVKLDESYTAKKIENASLDCVVLDGYQGDYIRSKSAYICRQITRSFNGEYINQRKNIFERYLEKKIKENLKSYLTYYEFLLADNLKINTIEVDLEFQPEAIKAIKLQKKRIKI